MSQATIPDLPFNGSLNDGVLFEISNAGVSESTDLESVVFGLQAIDEKNAANGYAGLDSSGLISASQIPDLSGTYQILTEKDVANGYAGLDATGLLLLGTIPDLPQSRTIDLETDLADRELLANKVTSVGTPGNDTNYVTEKGIRDALDLKEDSLGFTPENVINKVTSVGTPGNDTNYPSEKAVRDALDLKEDSLGFTPENIANKVTVIGTPGDDTNYPTEKASRDALDLKEDSLGFTPEDVANKSVNLLTPDNTKYPTTLAVTNDLLFYQLLTGKGAASGYAGLDGSSELLLANFPSGTALQVLRRNAGNTALEFADPAGGGSQTPWTSNIDAAGFNLFDLSYMESNATFPAQSGAVRLGDTEAISWRNGSNDGDVFIDSNDLEIAFNIWESIVFADATDVDFNNAAVQGILSFDMNGGGNFDLNNTPATSFATIQFSASNQAQAIALGNTEVISWEKNGGVGYAGLSSIATDEFIIGFSAASPGALVAEYTFTETTADFLGNTLTNVSIYETAATFPADAGAIRLGDLQSIGFRNSTNDGNFDITSDDPTITFNGWETVEFPDATIIEAGQADLQILTIDMSGDIVVNGFSILQPGLIESNAGTPADAGFLRMGNTEILAWRDFGDTGNITLTVNASDQFAFNSVLTVGNNVIKAVDTPVDGTDAANKTYVDNLVNGLVWKDSALVATTGNITLSGEQTIDGVLTSTSRVLVKDQTSGQFNGVYDTAAGAWTRTTDADTDVELNNMSIFITSGTVNDGSSWTQTTDLPITVDTTVLNYAQVGAGPINPLTTKGDIFGYDTESTRIPVGTDGQTLIANSAVALGVEWQTIGSPLIAKGDLFTFTTVDARLPVGITGQILSANAGETTGLEWIDNDSSPLTSKGDIFTYTTVNERLAVGSNGQVLTANAAQPTGLEWTTVAGVGDVVGPAGATDNAIARYDLATGKLIQNSGVIIDDNNTTSHPGPIVLTAAGTVPSGTETYFREVSNDLIVNVASAQEMDFNFGTTTRVTFTQSGIDLLTNDLAQATITSSSTLNATQVLTGLTYGNGIKQIFNPSSANTGLNVGAQADPDPSAPVNGDIYYNSTSNKFRVYENSGWIDMIGGTGDIVGPGSSTDNAVVRFDGTTGKLAQDSTVLIDDDGDTVFPRSIQWAASATLPTAGLIYAQHTTSALRTNVPTGSTFVWTIQGASEMNLSPTGINFQDKNLTVGTGYIDLEEISTPANPVANVGRLYTKDVSAVTHLFFLDSAGTDIDLSIAGDVSGPGSSTDNEIAIYDSTTGKIIQNNGSGAQPVTISDESYVSGIRALTFSGFNTTQGTGLHWIQYANSNLHFNVSTGGYKLDQAGTTLFQLTTSSALIPGLNLILDDNFIQTDESAGDPASPGAGANRLYTKDVAGRSHLFIRDDVGAVDVQASTGDVSGPASSVDNTLVTFDGATGKLIQGAGTTGFEVIVDSAGQPTWPRAILFTNTTVQPAASSTWIESFFSDIQLNVSTGNTINFSINAGVVYTFNATTFSTINKDITIGTSYLEIEEIATPSLPSANRGRLYTKDVSTETHLFFIDSSGNDTDIIALGGAQTPITQDVDYDGFDILDLSNIEFRNTTGAPAITTPSIYWDTSLAPDALNLNVPSNTEIIFRYNGVEEYTFSPSIFNGNDNILQNWSAIQLSSISDTEVRIENDFGSIAPGALIGKINFRADQSDAAAIDYCRIQTIASTVTDATASGDMQLMCLVGGAAAPVSFIRLRGQLDQIEITKPITMGGQTMSNIGNLQFNASGTVPAGTIAYIDKLTTEFAFNVPNAHTYSLSFNNIANYEFTQNVFDIMGNNLNGVTTINDTNGLQLINMTQVASAVNELNVSNAVTATNPILGVSGNDTNIGLDLVTKGTGLINLNATADLLGNDLDNIQNLIHDLSTSGTDVNFNEDQLQEISISANTTFTGINYAIGKSKTLKITTDGTLRTLAFPAGWVFVGIKPTDQAASKEGILTLTCFSAVEAGVIAAYSVEA